MSLFVSQGVDEVVLQTVEATWTSSRATLLSGEAIVESSAKGSSAIVPIIDDERLVGLLYVRSDDLRFADERDRNALAQFGRIAAMVLLAPAELPVVQAGVETYLERTTADDVARQQLLVLLEKSEWNIARVARLMGVTRVTIYNRLARLGIQRRRVPKGQRPKRQPA